MTTPDRILRNARVAAGLSQAELARRSGLPRTVVNAYERNTREPGVGALTQALAPTHRRLRATRPTTLPDAVRAATILEQVLDLADGLPRRSRKRALARSPFRP